MKILRLLHRWLGLLVSLVVIAMGHDPRHSDEDVPGR